MVSAHVTSKDLDFLSELIEAGKVRPEIDRRYPFAEIPAAIAYLEQGHAKGRSSWARREIGVLAALIPRPQPTVGSGGPAQTSRRAEPQIDRARRSTSAVGMAARFTSRRNGCLTETPTPASSQARVALTALSITCQTSWSSRFSFQMPYAVPSSTGGTATSPIAPLTAASTHS